MRTCAHAAVATRRQRPQLRHEPAVGVEEFPGTITAHPALEQLQAGGIAADIGAWHLMRSPRAFDFVPIDVPWPGPPFWRAQHDHRPARSYRIVRSARRLLHSADFA